MFEKKEKSILIIIILLFSVLFSSILFSFKISAHIGYLKTALPNELIFTDGYVFNGDYGCRGGIPNSYTLYKLDMRIVYLFWIFPVSDTMLIALFENKTSDN